MSTISAATKAMNNLSLGEKKGKAGHPERFYGQRNKVHLFILQIKLYFADHGDDVGSDDAKCRFIALHLGGLALEWCEKNLNEFLTAPMTDWTERTKALFMGPNEFLEEIEKAFGNPDQGDQAARKLDHLKQKGSVQDYAAEFQRITNQLNYDDDLLQRLYIKGLKERVQHAILTDDSEDLHELIATTTKIDNKQYEIYLERKGQGRNHWAPRKKNHGNRGQSGHNHQGYGRTQYNWDPMEIDATKRHPFKKGAPRRQGTKCYNCNKIGHIAKNCRAPKKGPSTWKRNSTFATAQHETRNISATIMKEIKTETGGTPSTFSRDEETVSQITRQNTQENKDLHEEISSESSFELVEIYSDTEQEIIKVLKDMEKEDFGDIDTDQEEQTPQEKEVHIVKGHDELLKLIKMMEDEHAEKKKPQKQDSDTQLGKDSPGQLDTPHYSSRGTNLPEETKEEYEHGKLHFSACYDDYCYTHLQEKEGANWFPSVPHKKGKKNCQCEKCKEKEDGPVKTCNIPLDDSEWEVCHDPNCEYHREGERREPWNTIAHRKLLPWDCQLDECDYHNNCQYYRCKYHTHPPMNAQQGKDQLSH